MGAKLGQVNVGAGRPKGSPNKSTIQIKNALTKAMDEKLLPQLMIDLAQLDALDRAKLIVLLIGKVIPNPSIEILPIAVEPLAINIMKSYEVKE